MAVIKIETPIERHAELCIEALQKAIDDKPDAVCVFYRKNGLTYHRSVFFSRLETIGALEAAKQEIWSAE